MLKRVGESPLKLVKDRCEGISSLWQLFLGDSAKRSFAYVLRRQDNAHFSPALLQQWFEALHPDNLGEGSWDKSYYQGQELLRKTAWWTMEAGCTCEYGYSDTWQKRITNLKMQKAIEDITRVVKDACGMEELNSVNMNYYPTGGGVGFHADDEFLFDGLERDVAIISLSLCSKGGANGQGRRKFQVRLKKAFQKEGSDEEVHDLCLEHGDLASMEGLHQLFYLHSVWPGDSQEYTEHPLTQGERINLTWRTIVKHLDGSDECKGLRCQKNEVKPTAVTATVFGALACIAGYKLGSLFVANASRQ